MDWNIVWTILLGALSGYVASRIIGGEGFGFLGNIVVGVLGGIIGSWLIKILKIEMMSGFFGNLVASVGGALLLILFIEVIKYFGRSSAPVRRRRR